MTVPLSGPLNMGNFIERLLMQMQKWRSCDCLHLDIGLTHEVDLLDDILVPCLGLNCSSGLAFWCHAHAKIRDRKNWTLDDLVLNYTDTVLVDLA